MVENETGRSELTYIVLFIELIVIKVYGGQYNMIITFAKQSNNNNCFALFQFSMIFSKCALQPGYFEFFGGTGTSFIKSEKF